MTPTANELHPDPLFVEPFIDGDEQRDEPVPHRSVHGGFRDTDLRFSMYFPPGEQYEGRFYQPLMHIAGDENVALTGQLAGLGTRSIEFAFASGGYLVESNQGSTLMMGPPDITGFRASAATAQYSRIVAAEMYGEHRPHGYVFGGSGGAYKTMACIENTDDVWDGAVPFIHGSHLSMPNVFTVQAHAFRVLDGCFDQIVDAIEPGGSGDMYAGLDDEQRAALEEVTRMGFPPRAWFAHERVALSYTGVFAAIFGTLALGDPDYFEDFWSEPGYLGADPPQSLVDARVRHTTTVTAIVTTEELRRLGLPVSITAGTRDSAPAAFRLADLPAARLQGAFLTPSTGEAIGERLMITGVIDDLVMLGFGGVDIGTLEKIRIGDEVGVDNSDYLAAQTYHRHQNPSSEYPVWNQFRGPDGEPLHPLRPLVRGFDQVGAGNSWQSGRFTAKMITVNCLMDEAAFPWQADWYRARVGDALGPRFEEQYRLWFVDHAMHVNPSRYLSPNEGAEVVEGHGPTDTHIVSYTGILQQALRDVAAWAEQGITPPAGTNYHMDDGQVVVPPTAHERRGVQPVVTLTVDGGARADVAVGEPVELVGVAEVPPDAGVIVSAEWDDDGRGTYPEREVFEDPTDTRMLTRTTSFPEPGTHFVTLRVASQRHRALGTPYGKARNLDRIRVVVS
ncbi:MAG: hypothetical protein OES57_10480 [Acidimicrobiia bacterium]|nr:hypothetical protein [Acidimicrobiia bacterium]